MLQAELLQGADQISADGHPAIDHRFLQGWQKVFPAPGPSSVVATHLGLYSSTKSNHEPGEFHGRRGLRTGWFAAICRAFPERGGLWALLNPNRSG